MSIKKLILKLEKYFKQKFTELDAGFYVYIWYLTRLFFLIQIIMQYN